MIYSSYQASIIDGKTKLNSKNMAIIYMKEYKRRDLCIDLDDFNQCFWNTKSQHDYNS